VGSNIAKSFGLGKVTEANFIAPIIVRMGTSFGILAVGN